MNTLLCEEELEQGIRPMAEAICGQDDRRPLTIVSVLIKSVVLLAHLGEESTE